MELNKIIRRSGLSVSASYAQFLADLTDALKDIKGILKEEVKEEKNDDGTVKEPAHVRFSLDSTKNRYDAV